ncbi:hypothetical protein Droror1_Dr00025534, partial [Drosera rotundifolia]
MYSTQLSSNKHHESDRTQNNPTANNIHNLLSCTGQPSQHQLNSLVRCVNVMKENRLFDGMGDVLANNYGSEFTVEGLENQGKEITMSG